MKLAIYFSCLFAVVMGSDVIELTDTDFDSKIGTFSTALVEFFAPWCGHCKKLAPEYEKAATSLKKSGSSIALIKVDCTANTAVCGKYDVSGYPTLKIFQGGEKTKDYDGPRQSDGIISYMKKQAEPASTDLDSVEAFEKFTAENAVIIGFFSSAEDDDAKKFSDLTGSLRDSYTFGHSYSADVRKAAGYDKENSVVLFRSKLMCNKKFEEIEVKFSGTVSMSNVKTFLKENYAGLCGQLTADNGDSFEKPLLTAFFPVDFVKNRKGTQYWRNRVMKFGKDQGITLSFANVDDFAGLLSEVGMTPGEKPIVLVRDKNDKKFVMEAEFKEDTLKKFIADFKEGKLTPKIKSEPVPESQDGPVTVVVGETFDDIVMDQNKDVLIEFYAPWCGHCKSLAPKWDELGEKMKGYDDIVIAKIDATANESPSQFAVSGFPTIYWAPKDNKENPVKYNGGREVAEFVSFIKTKTSNERVKTEL